MPELIPEPETLAALRQLLDKGESEFKELSILIDKGSIMDAQPKALACRSTYGKAGELAHNLACRNGIHIRTERNLLAINGLRVLVQTALTDVLEALYLDGGLKRAPAALRRGRHSISLIRDKLEEAESAA